MTPLNLVLVDDHTIVTDGLQAMLIGEPELNVVGAFTGSRELFGFLQTAEADVVLLDISLPGLSGIEIASLLRQSYPRLGILMLSAFTDEASITGAIKAGARGFLSKEASREELVQAVKTVAVGKRYFGRCISETVFDGYVKGIVKEAGNLTPGSPLSARENEIVRLFAEGLMYKEIADRLNISIKTVESHKANIMRKLELSNLAGLIKYALKKNLISL